MSVNQYEIGNEHPADKVIQAERAGTPSTVQLTAEELSGMARMNPADLVASLANSHAEVPPDSPVHKMSNDQLRNEMTKAMGAIGDFRKSQQQMNYMEQVATAAGNHPSNENVGNALRALETAQKQALASEHSARRAGLGDYEYNEATRQLAEIMDPSASPQAAQPNPAEQAADPNGGRPPAPANGQPYEINKSADGSYVVTIDTGERFLGKDADEVIEKLTHSKRKTGLWGRDLHAQLKQLRSGQTASAQSQQPNQPTSDQPQSSWESLGILPDESARYIIDTMIAKPLGFADSNELIQTWQGMQRKIAEQDTLLEDYRDNRETMKFLSDHPEFPATDSAADVLIDVLNRSQLPFTAQNLELAHTLAVQKHVYRPLSPEEIRVANGEHVPTQSRTVPPTPPPGGAPGNADQTNPWAMSTDELRKKVLEGGGLGKALLEMTSGSALGGQ